MTNLPLRVCSYEDRPEAIDSLLFMSESLCRAEPEVSLHLTVPDAPDSLRAWARRRPQVTLSTGRPRGVRGWDVKPWLLIEELNEGIPETLWLDSDMIVTRAISPILREFPSGLLIVAEEWDRPAPIPVASFWDIPASRAVAPVNSCFIRVLQDHRPLLERWLEMARTPEYREAQALPFDQRPFHLGSDQVLLTALLSGGEFGRIRFDSIRIGRHIAQCAGSSGYRPTDRMLDLFRGLPPMIHCIGRKPWDLVKSRGRSERFLIDVATDVSPYVLAAKRVAKNLDMHPKWMDARTAVGAMLRGLTAGHPGMAGLPLAIPHAAFVKSRYKVGLRWDKRLD